MPQIISYPLANALSGTELFVIEQTSTKKATSAQIKTYTLGSAVGGTLFGRAVGAGTGLPGVLTASQARTVLNVADGANNYIHPSDGVDPGAALTGATVFSDITVNTAGHVTGTTTRELSLTSLSDVKNSFVGLADGQVLTYDSVNGWQNETSPAGVTDHLLLDNRGLNTHDQIDAHLALVNEHIDWTLDQGATNIHPGNYVTYTHPNDGVDPGAALTGAAVFSDITVNAAGHVTGSAVRNLSLGSLLDVQDTFVNLIEGQVLTYSAANGWQNQTSPTGVTDHLLLDNIGLNTHDQIDTHLALVNEHVNWKNGIATGFFSKGIRDSVTTGTDPGLRVTATGITLTSQGFNYFQISQLATDKRVDLTANTIAGHSLGPTLRLYGLTHSIKQGDIEFQVDNVLQLWYDHSASSWDFGSNDVHTANLYYSGDLIYEGSSRLKLNPGVTTTEINVSGGASDISGANLEMSGPAALEPYAIKFKSDTVNELTFDYSAAEWNFTNNNIVTTGTITASNFSGVNTGDQTSIVGITGTTAQFNTALTDGDFAIAGGPYHDTFSDFVANEHIDWTNTVSNLYTTGSVWGNSVIADTDVQTQEVLQLYDIGSLRLSGSNGAGAGANLVLMGDNIALGNRYDILFRAAAVDKLTFDYSASLWDFADNDISTTGTLIAGNIPASGGGTTNFLRADGTWAAPPGVSDHALLSNIGINTHTQIDSHLSLVNEHIDWTSTTANFSTDGTLTCPSIYGQYIQSGLTSGSVTISGGTPSSGPGITLYGPFFAGGLGRDVVFWDDLGTNLYYDSSIDLWDFKTGRIYTTDVVQSLDVVLDGSDDTVRKSVTTGSIILTGGNSATTGANIRLYGSTEATTPLDFLFRTNTITQLHFDYSATLWDFQDNNITIGGILAVDTINEDTTATGVTIDGALIKDSNLILNEASSGVAPTAGKGSYWVKNTTPSTPMFKDDTSIEFELLGETIIIACSDETSDLTTGTAVVTFYMPWAFELVEIQGSLTTAPTGSILIADVNLNGATIMTTNKIDIDIGELTTETALTAPGLTTTSFAKYDTVTVDIDQIGSTVAGSGLKIYLIGRRK